MTTVSYTKGGLTGPKGKLTITVVEGRNLRDVQLIGKQDPYVKLSIGKEKFKTRVHENGGVTPSWNQSFIFNLTGHDSESHLHFFVLDSNTVSDTDIGRSDLPMSQVLTSLGEKWIQLVDKDNFAKHTGQIKIIVEWGGAPVVHTGDVHTDPAHAATPVQPVQVAVAPATAPVQHPPQYQVQPQQPGQQPLYPPVGGSPPGYAPQYNTQQPIQPQYQPVQQQQPQYQQQPPQYQPVQQQQQPQYQQYGTQPIAQPQYAPYPGQQYAPVVQPGYAPQQFAPAPTFTPYQTQIAQPIALSSPPPAIQIPQHPHPLYHQGFVYDGRYVCNICGQSGTGGVYHCDICQWDSHVHCVRY